MASSPALRAQRQRLPRGLVGIDVHLKTHIRGNADRHVVEDKPPVAAFDRHRDAIAMGDARINASSGDMNMSLAQSSRRSTPVRQGLISGSGEPCGCRTCAAARRYRDPGVGGFPRLVWRKGRAGARCLIALGPTGHRLLCSILSRLQRGWMGCAGKSTALRVTSFTGVAGTERGSPFVVGGVGPGTGCRSPAP